MSAAAVLGWRQLGGICCLPGSGVGAVSLYLAHESRVLLSCPHNRNVFFEAGHFFPLKLPLPAWSLHCPILTLAGPPESAPRGGCCFAGLQQHRVLLASFVWAWLFSLGFPRCPAPPSHPLPWQGGQAAPADCCTLTYTDPKRDFARCAPPTGSRIPSCAQASVVPNSLPLSCGTQTLLLPPGSSPGFWA